MQLRVESACNVKAADGVGTSDPFVKVTPDVLTNHFRVIFREVVTILLPLEDRHPPKEDVITGMDHVVLGRPCSTGKQGSGETTVSLCDSSQNPRCTQKPSIPGMFTRHNIRF